MVEMLKKHGSYVLILVVSFAAVSLLSTGSLRRTLRETTKQLIGEIRVNVGKSTTQSVGEVQINRERGNIILDHIDQFNRDNIERQKAISAEIAALRSDLRVPTNHPATQPTGATP